MNLLNVKYIKAQRGEIQSPLTLDFDKGVHRSDFRKDVRERKLETVQR